MSWTAGKSFLVTLKVCGSGVTRFPNKRTTSSTPLVRMTFFTEIPLSLSRCRDSMPKRKIMTKLLNSLPSACKVFCRNSILEQRGTGTGASSSCVVSELRSEVTYRYLRERRSCPGACQTLRLVGGPFSTEFMWRETVEALNGVIRNIHLHLNSLSTFVPMVGEIPMQRRIFTKVLR